MAGISRDGEGQDKIQDEPFRKSAYALLRAVTSFDDPSRSRLLSHKRSDWLSQLGTAACAGTRFRRGAKKVIVILIRTAIRATRSQNCYNDLINKASRGTGGQGHEGSRHPVARAHPGCLLPYPYIGHTRPLSACSGRHPPFRRPDARFRPAIRSLAPDPTRSLSHAPHSNRIGPNPAPIRGRGPGARRRPSGPR